MITHKPNLTFTILTLTLCVQTCQSIQCPTKSSESSTPDDERGQTLFDYKLLAAASILVAGGIGVCLPWLPKLTIIRPMEDGATCGGVELIGKAFAGGVILATGLVHVLPEAVEKLGSPCLSEVPWGKFPFAGFVSMMFCLATLMIESLAVGVHRRQQHRGHGGDDKTISVSCDFDRGVVNHHDRRGSQFDSSHVDDDETICRRKIVSQILELGVLIDSTIIGISLGTCKTAKTMKSLMAVLTFNQFFEGVGIGETISHAEMKLKLRMIMALIFTIIAPVGIGIGIGISNYYEDNSSTSLIVEGLFDSASAGIIIYMALINLLATHFMGTSMLSSGLGIQFGSYASLILGAACMSLLNILY
ncbi:Zinc transporter 1 [Linum perenne]